MRVTIDIDNNGFLGKIHLTYAMLALRLMSRGNAYCRRSANKRFHVKCHGLRISFRTSLFMRFLLMDDDTRIRKDVERLKKPKQILWTHKDGKTAGVWLKSIREVIA